MRHLRWLTLLGFLGLLGHFTEYHMLKALFGFFAFFELFWYDERTEALFKQAAAITFVVTTFALTGTFVYLAVVLGPGLRNAEDLNLVRVFAQALAFTYIAHLLTFFFSYWYYQVRGLRA